MGNYPVNTARQFWIEQWVADSVFKSVGDSCEALIGMNGFRYESLTKNKKQVKWVDDHG
jgi:hypothetical protein